MAELIEDMARFIPELKLVQDRAKLEILKNTLRELLELVEEASKFVVDRLGNKVDGARVAHFKARFEKLQNECHRRVGIQLLDVNLQSLNVNVQVLDNVVSDSKCYSV